MNQKEKNFIDYVQKNSILWAFVAVSVTALLVRLNLFYFVSDDYVAFIEPWLNKLRDAGGIKGLGQEIGEYNVPYMLFLSIVSLFGEDSWLHSVKFFSVFFDYVGAYAVAAIAAQVCKKPFHSIEGLLGFSAYLLTPVTFLDSSCWAQCDSIYCAMLLLCIYSLLREKSTAAMIFFGLAFSFKLQAVFFLPVLVIFYFVTKKIPAVKFLLIPAVYLVLLIPALILGRGISSTLGIYFAQTDLYEWIYAGCPTIYCWLNGDYHQFKTMGIFLALSVIGVGSAVYISRAKKLTAKGLIILSLWVTSVCVFLLPAMHERYLFVPCALSIVWMIVHPKDWYIALTLNLTTALTFCYYLFDNNFIDYPILAIANLFAIVMITRRLFFDSSISGE